jgi:hypothetical protein
MKKLADTFDMKNKPTNIGDYVFFAHFRLKEGSSLMLGKLLRIDGAYHYVESVLCNQDIWELYPSEFERVDKEKATLWMFENM